MKKFMLLTLSVILFGCSSNNINQVVAKDGSEQKYRLVEPSKKLPDGTTRVELWEKIDPLQTNYWFTPTLGSSRTNETMMFQSLMR